MAAPVLDDPTKKYPKPPYKRQSHGLALPARWIRGPITGKQVTRAQAG